ncbi:hypothetical protein EDD66_103213 [Mobilisporobacter senegalensis]|uniref:Spermatogenesis-associated protein 20-like TRX domain-containing protein n=1 Tax=Mobilisporobacter senegalensis TaxID=1329262 RepID=A0A3N1XWG0_9FIRM|nr:thioredoxin domain-containing protein [Mobilisporobacter senegalensis]ROR29277.1 hypothetical protein EDD66_103213 [Mobilisporobacter senegalensis]
MIADMKTHYPNKLAKEKSPYLLQHAYNPVNWYPWGEEAFKKAKKENKPIFLSIGYSTCHWCHVMERESFEDEEIAGVLNGNFVSIKVDKEERPDIDAIYMGVCQALTGHGGWPLTIVMTPEQKPFYAGTYFPKTSKYGMTGLMDLLDAISKQWKENKDVLISSSENIVDHIRNRDFSDSKIEGKVSKDLIKKAKRQFEHSFDNYYGGFHNAPKFPTPHNLMFLLRFAYFEKDKQALQMVEKTLEQMYKGGIFDHIGFGFSRYSTDGKWLIPHFEKMLYDNALLAMTYLETYQLTRRDLYKKVAVKIFDYVLKELTYEEGGFFCAQDADSEGIEGKYYVFTPEETIKILGQEDGNYYNDYFDITIEGNFEGNSIPNLIMNNEYDKENQRIQSLSKKLYDYRLTRTKLHKDDKILTSWNALMTCAFAKGYQILGKEQYRSAADRAVQFTRMYLSTEDGRLKVRFREGDSSGVGHIDDYAFFIWSLLEMYDATYQADYLKEAIDYTNKMILLFFDKEKGGFYLYAKDSEQLIFRPKEVYDGAIPSGNSVAAFDLLRIAKLTGESKYEDYASLQLKYISGVISDYPSAYSYSLIGLIQVLYPSKEIIIVIKDQTEKEKILKIRQKFFLPNTVIMVKEPDNERILNEIAGFTKEYQTKDNMTTIYICENHACKAPFHEFESLYDSINRA